ncbi:MAG: M15 family metallopeptidase [Chlamydiota bacterium]
MIFNNFNNIFKITLATYISMHFIFSTCEAHTPSPCKKENKFLISKPVLNLHEECSIDSPLVSQAIYGHSARLIKKIIGGWALIETEDGYRGYALSQGLLPDNPQWRTSKSLVKVSSVAGLVFPIEGTERPHYMQLPFDARIEVVKELDSTNERWVEVKLINGKYAWMQRGDLEKPTTKTLQEVIKLSHKFLERPFIWGGTSSEGFDRSGYIQTLFKQMGIILPRDSRPQMASQKVTPIKNLEKVGDLVFLGGTTITQEGMYLGSGKFIRAGIKNNEPRISIAKVEDSEYKSLTARRIKETSYQATISPITDEIKAKITYSWRDDNPVPLSNLRYIKLNHWGFDGYVHEGELIVHEKIAGEVVDIFEELFEAQYPIEKMLLIDEYKADDDLSCEDNNASAFCSRPITGSTTKWSYHSFGLAIDINPVLNPYHKGNTVVPVNGTPFLDRSLNCRGIIDEDDICYKAFTKRGWKWGGHWTSLLDYQHFYKDIAY